MFTKDGLFFEPKGSSELFSISNNSERERKVKSQRNKENIKGAYTHVRRLFGNY
jgi:hypothetical protein